MCPLVFTEAKAMADQFLGCSDHMSNHYSIKHALRLIWGEAANSNALLQHTIDKIISLLPNLLEVEFDILSHMFYWKIIYVQVLMT